MSHRLRTRIETLRPIFDADWQWIMLAQLAAVAGTMILLKAVANVATPEEFGRFGLILAVAGGVNSLAFGPVIAWTNRHYQEAREAGRLRGYFRTLLVASAIAIAGASTLVLLIIVWAPNAVARLGMTSQQWLLGLIVGLLLSANEVAVAVSNAALRRRPAAIFLISARWLPVVFVVASYWLGYRSVAAYASAVAVALSAVLVIQVGQLVWIESRASRPSPLAGFEGSYLRSLATYALPYVLWGIPAYLITFGDRYVLAYFTDAATVGAYVAMLAATIGAVNVFGAAVNRVLEPAVYATSGASVDRERAVQAHRMIRTAIFVIIVVLIPVVAIYHAFPLAVISLFTAASYGAYADSLWVLMLAGLFFLVGQELFLHGNVEKRLWAYLPVRLIQLAIFAIAVALLVPHGGLPGLALALLMGYVSQALLVLAINRWIIRWE